MFKNFSSLTVLQISNYIFPLITFPYLVRVLGPEKFGLANFAFAFTQYFITVTDYGFNLSASREISIFRGNQKQINSIFNATIFIKISLFLISSVIYLVIIFSISKFNNEFSVYGFAFIAVLGNVLFASWFFQGIEKMGYITAFTIIFRAISVILIFLMIKNSENVLEYILINSGYMLLIGLISLAFIFKQFDINFFIPTRYQILRQLKKGWHIFLSTISINIYTTSNTFLLGLLSGEIAVGYFATANKLREAVQGIFSNSGRTVYPHLSNLFNQSKAKAANFVKKYLEIVGTLSFLASLICLIFAHEIIFILAGDEYEKSVLVFQILAFLPFIIVLSNVFGIQVMLNLGYSKEFNKIIAFAALINLICMFIFVPLFEAAGAGLSMMITELFVTIVMVSFVIKKKILVLNAI